MPSTAFEASVPMVEGPPLVATANARKIMALGDERDEASLAVNTLKSKARSACCIVALPASVDGWCTKRQYGECQELPGFVGDALAILEHFEGKKGFANHVTGWRGMGSIIQSTCCWVALLPHADGYLENNFVHGLGDVEDSAFLDEAKRMARLVAGESKMAIVDSLTAADVHELKVCVRAMEFGARVASGGVLSDSARERRFHDKDNYVHGDWRTTMKKGVEQSAHEWRNWIPEKFQELFLTPDARPFLLHRFCLALFDATGDYDQAAAKLRLAREVHHFFLFEYRWADEEEEDDFVLGDEFQDPPRFCLNDERPAPDAVADCLARLDAGKAFMDRYKRVFPARVPRQQDGAVPDQHYANVNRGIRQIQAEAGRRRVRQRAA